MENRNLKELLKLKARPRGAAGFARLVLSLRSSFKFLFSNFISFKIKSSGRGFTLIETVMAMAIIASGLLLLANTWGGSFVRLDRTQKSFEMASLLERKMLDIELKYRGKNIDEIKESEEGEFDGFPEYRWKMSSQKLEFPDLSGALTSRDGGADSITLMAIKQLTDALSKSIKEVTVSVTYTRKGKKPIEHSVTTYFVDYTKSPQVGLPQ